MAVVVLTLLPALLVGAYLSQWLFLREETASLLALAEGVVFVGALCVPPFIAFRLRNASFGRPEYRTVTITTVVTALLVLGIVALYHIELRVEGHLLPVAEVVEGVLFGGAIGTAIGAVAGLYRARTMRREQQLTDERETLASRTALLSTLTQNLPAGILVEDADRQVLFSNQAFCEMFKIEAAPEALVGTDCMAAAENIKEQFVDSERFIERTNDVVETEASSQRDVFDLVDGRTLERRITAVELGETNSGNLWVYRDVTEQKRYERRLSALHESTRELMSAQSPETIATEASEAASDILQLPLNGIHLYDETVEGLVPVAWSDATETAVGEPPVFTSGDGIAWRTFEAQETTVHRDVREADDVYNPDTPIKSEMYLPLGEYGVFLIGSTEADAFEQTDIALAKILATNLEAALARAEREAKLRDREAQLSRERDRLATLFETIPDPAVTVDLQNGEPIVQTVNEAFEAVFGYASGEVVGTPINELIVPPEFEAEAANIDDRAVANEQLVREVRRQTADGEIRDFLFRNIPIESEPSTAYGIYTDITDRKRRERTLEALNNITRQQLQASSQERICELTVTAVQNTLDRPLSVVHLLDDEGRALRPVAMTTAVTDHLDEGDLGYTAGDNIVWNAFDTGETRVLDDVETVSEPMLDDPNTPVRSAIIIPLGTHGVLLIGSVRAAAFDDDDVYLSELLAATTTIALDRTIHEQQLARLHEATRDLMTISDEQTIAERTLEAATEILGYSLVSVRYHDTDRDVLVPVALTDVGRSTLGEPDIFERGESLAWEPLETGEPQLVDDVTTHEISVNAGSGVRSLLILPIGEYGTLNIAATAPAAFDDEDISLARILAANVETALDRADDERALRAREQELRRQNERLEEFAGVLSHDLRNPLTIANGRLELLDIAEENDHVAAIRRAHDRMEALIEDVLTLARQGQTVGETSPLSVKQVATEAWQTVETANATLEIDADVVIGADPGRIQQLFENLFRNAIEHGRDDVTVRVGALPDAGGFVVTDDGPGIPPAEWDQVFDQGYTTATDGTGFGLSIVQQIVGAHGWTISVDESADGGARFEIDTDHASGGHDV